MTLTLMQIVLGGISGSLVGLTLGLVGGGGSILAVPLMVYLVGVSNPHIAIGTSALAVAVNAGTNALNHARAGNVKWGCAVVFALAGVLGAFGGSSLGKLMDGQKLLALFAVLMLVVAALMFRSRSNTGDANVQLSPENAPKLLALGGLTGVFSGFFGIGGGFLVVPSLMAATRMPIIYAVGSSLVAVCAFGLTTAANYARSGLIDWPLAGVFITGGLLGGFIGARLSSRLALQKGLLNSIFAGLIVLVASYMLYRSAAVFGLL